LAVTDPTLIASMAERRARWPLYNRQGGEALDQARSGKVLRKVVRQSADGEAYLVPSTIDDPASLGEVAALLAAR